jgi:hypothetical protein
MEWVPSSAREKRPDKISCGSARSRGEIQWRGESSASCLGSSLPRRSRRLAFSQKFIDIAVAQREPDIEPDGVPDHLGPEAVAQT